jgi:hypothetical protein
MSWKECEECQKDVLREEGDEIAEFEKDGTAEAKRLSSEMASSSL